MPITAPPTITALPSPPDPNNRATFNTLAYPWSVAQQTLATEVGAVAANVYANAQEAETQASLATTNGAAQVALAAAQASNAAVSAADANTAKLAAQAAQAAAEGAISALPDGTVNDSTVTLTDTWSSSKINAELTTLDGQKQDELVSGTNIKTFCGQSLLGSGDIVPPESWQVSDVIQTSRALSAPDWLPCDGGVYLQASYAALYAELGLIPDKIPGDKIANPANLPPSTATGCSWDASGTYLAVAHDASPYITVYKNTAYDESTQFAVPKVNAGANLTQYIKA